MHKNYSHWRSNESSYLHLALHEKIWTFPYKDPIEGRSKERNKYTIGIGKDE